MSSHHFVTEDQEPVLIFDNGPYCSIELMGQLLEWSPKVITLGEAGYRLTEMGVKVDVMICNNAPQEDFVQLYQPLKVIVSEDECFESCLKYLQNEGYLNAHFLWINDTSAFEQLVLNSALPNHFVMWNDQHKVFAINNTFEKFYGQGTRLRITGTENASGEMNFDGESISINGFQEVRLQKACTIKIQINSGRALLKEFF